MEERRKGDRRDPTGRYELSPETLQLLRLCGASVRSGDDPESPQGAVPADRRRRDSVAQSEAADASAPTPP